MKLKSAILVFLQFALLSLHLVLFGIYCSHLLMLGVQLVAGILGVCAIIAMRIGNLSVSPEIKQGSVLVMRGPYKVIRHPMYTAIILYTIPLTVEHPCVKSMGVQLFILSVLLYKMFYEESLLLRHFANYSEYKKKTWRIIPGIF